MRGVGGIGNTGEGRSSGRHCERCLRGGRHKYSCHTVTIDVAGRYGERKSEWTSEGGAPRRLFVKSTRRATRRASCEGLWSHTPEQKDNERRDLLMRWKEKPWGLLKRKVYRHNGTHCCGWIGVVLGQVEERLAGSGREACCLVETLPRVVLGETSPTTNGSAT
jgi:hypothetical protein